MWPRTVVHLVGELYEEWGMDIMAIVLCSPPHRIKGSHMSLLLLLPLFPYPHSPTTPCSLFSRCSLCSLFSLCFLCFPVPPPPQTEDLGLAVFFLMIYLCFCRWPVLAQLLHEAKYNYDNLILHLGNTTLIPLIQIVFS